MISMAIQKLAIDHFLSLSSTHPVLDVRSPGEFLHAHLPGAYSFPLFDDEQRKILGTTYKQQSRHQAIKTGLEYFGVKMRKMVEEAGKIIAAHQPTEIAGTVANNNLVLVHCWRGGMRSGAVAWLLDLYGYKVYTLAGGYKTFRNWVLRQFEKPYNFRVLGGYTGSGKTMLLQELKRLGYAVIDLEGLANHKGSAFGEVAGSAQPGQEMFENILAIQLSRLAGTLNRSPHEQGFDSAFTLPEIWIEDESRRIGLLNLPKTLWENMRDSPLYFLEVPFSERLDYVISVYGMIDTSTLTHAIVRISKRLGGAETKRAVELLSQNNLPGAFSILLKYYDKCYIKGLHSRKNLNNLLNKITCSTVTIKNIISLPLLQNVVK